MRIFALNVIIGLNPNAVTLTASIVRIDHKIHCLINSLVEEQTDIISTYLGVYKGDLMKKLKRIYNG
ncbi:hypothetical protein [Ureibacillus acetophenoni]|uniref:Uncharacterized protein n=1 Tax=Ureibacillus acetophenoni TaxID=614649 RepID=A0A285UP31_9BACL|nr:hypothetical protein [Ureibacillus acetophenoni]SOC43665.1 hypothetical protein SAMN05877842_1176 [Ureibacillus acetophenoni]